MDGPGIIAASLSRPGRPDRYGNTWQYHSRSDRHSKIACWAVLYDLFQNCALLREHTARGRVVIGVNREMRDYHSNRTKDLDLVIAIPNDAGEPTETSSMTDLALRWGVRLDADQQRRLEDLPLVMAGDTGSVLVALEAKACMTAHIKALPRLFDELNSSQQTVHGAIESALAVGLVMINASNTFISPDMNKVDLTWHHPNVNEHRQPLWSERAVSKVRELRRRSGPRETGFDALGILVVDMKNDGSPVRVVEDRPAPTPRDVDHYGQMILRIAHQYTAANAAL